MYGNTVANLMLILPTMLIFLLVALLLAGLWILSLRQQLAEKVDPWQMQETVMRMSGQQVPQNGPCITNGSLMYAGLMAEELAETYRALVAEVERYYAITDLDPNFYGTTRLSRDGYMVMQALQCAADELDVCRAALKKRLPEVDIYVPLTHEQAKDIFDGACDVPVVACGFALASGLPGAKGYRDVCGSNISKANPDTGVIDKEPDGKWIKGRDYKAPDLVAVLDTHYGGLMDQGLMPLREH